MPKMPKMQKVKERENRKEDIEQRAKGNPTEVICWRLEIRRESEGRRTMDEGRPR